jgi:hypothetical protein
MENRAMLDVANDIIQVLDSAVGCPALAFVEGIGSAKAILWPGNGANYRTLHLIELGPGARTIKFGHNSDAVYYVASGVGEIVDVSSRSRHTLIEGAVVHIDREDEYRFETAHGMKLIGGPCPADYGLYSDVVVEEAE